MQLYISWLDASLPEKTERGPENQFTFLLKESVEFQKRF